MIKSSIKKLSIQFPLHISYGIENAGGFDMITVQSILEHTRALPSNTAFQYNVSEFLAGVLLA